jgi:hypothetical protein
MTNEKRSFENLTDGEKSALRMLDEAEGVTSTGPCDLARTLTADRRLKASDPISMDFTHLLLEGWIVIRHHNHFDKIYRYGVCDEYQQLQPA